jgi:hypothetical protein
VSAPLREQAPTDPRSQPAAMPPGGMGPGSRAGLLAAIRPELVGQVAIEEPDTGQVTTLTRRLCEEGRREGAAPPHAA